MPVKVVGVASPNATLVDLAGSGVHKLRDRGWVR